MDFSNFFIPYVFDVKESDFRSFTRPLCSGDLENPSQLPVLLELEGTDCWVLWIFVISSFPRCIYSYRDLTKKRVCVHIHVSDNREMMPEAENNRLPVDVDNRETFCDDKSGLRSF